MTKTKEAIECLNALKSHIGHADELGMFYIETIRAALTDSQWQPIETAPRDGTSVLAYQVTDNYQSEMKWIEGEGYALWIYSDDVLSEIEPNPMQPTHWKPLDKPEGEQMDEETYSDSGPICHYCNYLHKPDEGYFYGEDFTEHYCYSCDSEFNVDVYVSYSWTCTKRETK